MGNIPAFHSRAVESVEARTRSALTERERADVFLSELDEMLSEPLEPTD